MSAEELTPAQIKLLKHAVNIQERMLDGCFEIFSGLRKSSDPEVVLVSEQALAAIQKNRDILDAMIDASNSTLH